MTTISLPHEKTVFEDTVRSLETQIANAGTHLTIDSTARLAYTREIKVMADTLRDAATRGTITWAEAALQAQETRNVVMMMIRGRSTAVGRALAQKMKAEGVTLNTIVARQTQKLHGKAAVFERLSASQQNAVYAEVVKSAGKSNVAVTKIMSRLAHAGRGLVVISLALSVYTIATADDKVSAGKKELAVTGAGIGGGMAAGALAGLACGPGAPLCVTVGAFVGGTLAALGVNLLW